MKRPRRATQRVAKQIGKSSQPARTPEPSKADSFPIVGIGASAGGLEAVRALLHRITGDGAAFVVIQHLAPNQASMLTDSRNDELLLALRQLKDGEREALMLVYWEQLSLAEAGQVLGCSANAVAIL